VSYHSQIEPILVDHPRVVTEENRALFSSANSDDKSIRPHFNLGQHGLTLVSILPLGVNEGLQHGNHDPEDGPIQFFPF
jgi:hypothetical protein